MSFKIPVSHDFLQHVARLDQFRGRWSSTRDIPTDRLARWKEHATIQSVASSCRIAGLHVADAEVAMVLRGGGAVGRDAEEIRGYADSIDRPFPEHGSLLDVIGPELRILFSGINPGLYSGATGHHFARPGNRFWPTLH